MKKDDEHFRDLMRGHQLFIELDAVLDDPELLRRCGTCWACRRRRECKNPLTEEQVIEILEADHAAEDQERLQELQGELGWLPSTAQARFMTAASNELGYHPPRVRKKKGRHEGSSHPLYKLEWRLAEISRRLRDQGEDHSRTAAKEVMATTDNTTLAAIEKRFERARRR